MTKAQAALLAVLALLGRRVYRTKLVKLVYLADNTFHELNGTTLTGFTYAWDRYGPNAVGNAIVNEAAAIIQGGGASMVCRPSMYGGEEYLYWAEPESLAKAAKLLSPGELQVLRDTVARFGGLNVRAVVAATKRTRPFQQANRYDILPMRQNETTASLQRQALANDSLVQSTLQGLDDLSRGNLISQEELDSLWQQRTSASKSGLYRRGQSR